MNNVHRRASANAMWCLRPNCGDMRINKHLVTTEHVLCRVVRFIGK